MSEKLCVKCSSSEIFPEGIYCKELDRWVGRCSEQQCVLEPCCGKRLYYDGDMGDKQAFCDERENFVSREFYCYRYEESDCWEGEEA